MNIKKIVEKVRAVDDGGLDIIKRIMIEEGLGECSAEDWNTAITEVLYELGKEK